VNVRIGFGRNRHVQPRPRSPRKGIIAIAAAVTVASGAVLVPMAQADPPGTPRAAGPWFTPLSTFTMADVGSAGAEIVSVTPDGKTLLVTSAAGASIGFVDITDPARPVADGFVSLGAPGQVEPTSVTVTPGGRWALATVIDSDAAQTPVDGDTSHVAVIRMTDRTVVRTIPVGGEPDSIAMSSTGRWAAVAVENEVSPTVPGFVAIIDILPANNPAAWAVRNVALTGLAAINAADPEPESVKIASNNVAAVTLQENNHIVKVNVVTGAVVQHFSAGTVTHKADLLNDREILLDQQITNSPRIPDGIAWIDGGGLVTANEGEGDLTGGRGFTVYSAGGQVAFDPGAAFELEAVRHGHYPDARSSRKGTEPEGIDAAKWGARNFLFVASERGNFLQVWRMGPNRQAEFRQLLPTGAAPEGVLAIPARDLVVTANEGDGTLSIFGGQNAWGTYPTVVSVDSEPPVSQALPWSALSGFSAGTGDTVHAVGDSALGAVIGSPVYTIDSSVTPAVVTRVQRLTQGGAKLSLDLEGIAVRLDGSGQPDPAGQGFWVVSEGSATTQNFLVRTNGDAQAQLTVQLPAAVASQKVQWGFEGVTVTGSEATGDEQVYVAFQREWLDQQGTGLVRIGRYTPATGAWAFYAYPLDVANPVSTALTYGLSEITAIDDTTFMVIERDSVAGAAAAIKKVYSFSIDGVTPTTCPADPNPCPVNASSQVLAKTLLVDLVAEHNYRYEKIESLGLMADGRLLIVNDNDGFGKTDLLRLDSAPLLAKLPVKVQLLGLNDFHGALKPTNIAGVPHGGVEYLSTWVQSLEATNPDNTLVVSAGDLIGASPLLSALFHDEPSIEAMNALGLDYNAVGNHEFDEGATELLRMQSGGCHPVDGCLDGDPFAGADFEFLAANVMVDATGTPLFPAFSVRELGGVKVAMIGMTLEGTPSIVTPSGVAGLTFNDEADTVNALVPVLQGMGVETIVVLVHEGGVPLAGGINDCNGISGPIVDIVDRLDAAVDVVVSGHTHRSYNCVIDGRIVTSAGSNGQILTDIDLQLDPTTGDMVSARALNRLVTNTVAKDPVETAIVAKYETLVTPLANRPIGTITATITRTNNAAGESALGDVIADAQLASSAVSGGAQIAFMNPGGIRADLTFPQSPAGEGDGVVTYGEAFTVQPFGNSLVTLTLTGAQIELLLEQQWSAIQPFARIMQVSDGFTYEHSYDVGDALGGDYIDPTSIKLNGITIDPGTNYRVNVNNFMASGGDNYTVLPTFGTNIIGGAQDIDALEAYLTANPGGVAPGPQNRIIALPT
jgi:5'-nucleotidase